MPKKTSPKKKPQSKTQFVLGLPKTMPVKDVVKAAKKAGIAITESYVYNIRYTAQQKGKKRPAVAPKLAAKKVPATTPKAKVAKQVSKTKYVLSLPKALTAAEVVEKAKGDGISLTAKYVYNIRGQAKGAKKKARAAKKPVATTTVAKVVAKAPVRATPRTGSSEERFVDLVLDIGLARSTELLSKIKERVKVLTLG
jgi:hypothetical protein